MTEYVPSLMNSIRMIHTISQYYNTSERMTSLFVKVTNQMISTCKAYINKGVSRIWDLPRYVYTRGVVVQVFYLIFLLDFVDMVGILHSPLFPPKVNPLLNFGDSKHNLDCCFSSPMHNLLYQDFHIRRIIPLIAL